MTLGAFYFWTPVLLYLRDDSSSRDMFLASRCSLADVSRVLTIRGTTRAFGDTLGVVTDSHVYRQSIPSRLVFSARESSFTVFSARRGSPIPGNDLALARTGSPALASVRQDAGPLASLSERCGRQFLIRTGENKFTGIFSGKFSDKVEFVIFF